MNARYTHLAVLAFSLAFAPVFGSLANEGRRQDEKESESRRDAQKVVRQGIAVEFSVEPAGGGTETSAGPREGEDAVVRFRITDTATGAPLTGLRPAAWIDGRGGGQPTDEKACREKVQSFLQGSLRARPAVDLNTYYILALNQEPSISVIDPLLGYGTSKLLALVLLKGRGEDWVLSRDGRRLFVTMPTANQVAVVDTATWKIVADLEAGSRPTRIALQRDGKYLWVTNEPTVGSDSQSGVTVIEATELTVVARIPTGAGGHALALSDDDRYAFVTNRQDATLSILDIRKLAKVKDVLVGRLPAALAFSPLSQAVYVVAEAEGTIDVVDGQKHAVLTRLKTKPGLQAIRFTPDGRWGFVVNRTEHVAHVLDASTNRILHTVEVAPGPDQIGLSGANAYIRSTGSEIVSMLPLNALGKGADIPVAKFPGGQSPPDQSTNLGAADAIVPTPEGHAVLVANPADRVIYYYKEGMAAPMGSFQNYRREPRAVLVVDRSLREIRPGEYAASVKFPRGGEHDALILLDSPRILNCFALTVRANPALAKKSPSVALRIEPLLAERKIRVGETLRLQLKVTDAGTNEARSGLKDVGVLATGVGGTWQQRLWAQSLGEGLYEVPLSVPRAGVYYVFFQVPSLRLRLNEVPPLILQATDDGQTPAASTEEAGGRGEAK